MIKKKIVICADDYGFSKQNSAAIRDLIAKKKINATSCMTDSKFWAQESISLKKEIEKNKNKSNCLVGLHFSLTEKVSSDLFIKSFFHSSNVSLLELLIRTKLRLVSFDKIYAILDHQYKNFTSVFDRPPCFIDGHQHVHQFPVIRDALIKYYNNHNLKKSKCYIRTTYPLLGSKDFFKQIIIAFSGAKRFKKLIQKNNILSNKGFSGLYKVKNGSYKYVRNCYKNFFNTVEQGSLIMCHPGKKVIKENIVDDIANRRVLEYKYFMSKDFDSDLASSSCTLQ